MALGGIYRVKGRFMPKMQVGGVGEFTAWQLVFKLLGCIGWGRKKLGLGLLGFDLGSSHPRKEVEDEYVDFG